MAVQALFVTSVLFLALGVVLLDQLRFLVPFRALIFGSYLSVVATFVGVLFLNVFAGVYLACRQLFLKDTGRKLEHLERQLRNGGAISRELAERLEE